MKLNLDFALYKGKTRLREWWKVVKAHFTAVQDAVNELDTDIKNEVNDRKVAISNEATTRANADSTLDGKISNEATARANADSTLDGKISNEATARSDEIRSLYNSTLPCYDLGSYYVYDGTTTAETVSGWEFYNQTWNVGKIIAFRIADRNTDKIAINTGGITPSGEKVKIEIEYPFKTGCSYKAIITGSRKAEVFLENGVFVKLTAEATARAETDRVLRDNITDAATAIAAEASAREAAENEIKSDITALKDASHTHGNKEIIDTITLEDVERWRELENQVTEEELTEAVANEAKDRVKGDEENKSYIEYLEKVCFGFSAELQNIYAAMGCTVYDGGLFGAPVDGAELNGGEFGDEESGIVDGSDFEPFRCSCGGGGTQTIDGGGYDNVSGSVIDGGSLDETGGTVIDGGVYP